MKHLFELDITKAPPGSRQVGAHLFRQLENAIREKRLPAGFKLPATRGAQSLFGVSRNTAQHVYDRLASEGLVTSLRGSGTYVQSPGNSLVHSPNASGRTDNSQVTAFWDRRDISDWINFWHEDEDSSVELVADLRPALIDQSLFPHAAFRQIMARSLRHIETHPASLRSPQRNQGSFALRSAISKHLGTTRAVACAVDDILITSGAQQAFDLIARTLVVPGKTVAAFENPGYPPMRVPFAAAGAKLHPVRVDSEGIVIEDIPAEARIICVCPSHQFPLGMSMTLRRRRELLRFARHTGAVIVEDDYDGEFRYDGDPLHALRGCNANDHVVYIGTFSKSMTPSLRLGYMVAPDWALPALVKAKNATDWHSPAPIQAAVAGFIAEGHLVRHIRNLRQVFRDRRDHLSESLARRLGAELTVIQSSYGMHLAALAREGVDCDSASVALADRGIRLHSLARYYFETPPRPGFIFGFGSADRQQIETVVDELARVLSSR